MIGPLQRAWSCGCWRSDVVDPEGRHCGTLWCHTAVTRKQSNDHEE